MGGDGKRGIGGVLERLFAIIFHPFHTTTFRYYVDKCLTGCKDDVRSVTVLSTYMRKK